MITEKLINRLHIVGNLAILAGLILVAIEINQNTASIQGAAYQEWVAANMELNMAATEPTLSHLFVLGNADSKNLSNESYVAFAMWNLGLMQMAQATDYMYRSGSLDRELWEAEINRAAGILDAPGVRQWWDAGGNTQLTPRFVNLMESTQSSIAIWRWDSERGFFRDDHLRIPLEGGPDSPSQ
jgi:hypothetical protein